MTGWMLAVTPGKPLVLQHLQRHPLGTFCATGIGWYGEPCQHGCGTPTVQSRTRSCIVLSLILSSLASRASSAAPPSACCRPSHVHRDHERGLADDGWPVSSRIWPRTDGSTISRVWSWLASATYWRGSGPGDTTTARRAPRAGPSRPRRHRPAGAWMPESSHSSLSACRSAIRLTPQNPPTRACQRHPTPRPPIRLASPARQQRSPAVAESRLPARADGRAPQRAARRAAERARGSSSSGQPQPRGTAQPSAGMDGAGAEGAAADQAGCRGRQVQRRSAAAESRHRGCPPGDRGSRGPRSQPAARPPRAGGLRLSGWHRS